MPPGARSRGCAACQRRKIKCDEKAPACGKCEKLGIECSGPAVGPLILPFDPQKKLQRQPRNALSTAPKDTSDSDGSSASQSLTPFASYGIRAISDSPTMRVWFTLKLQECVYIPHQRDRSIVSDLVKFSSSGEYPTLQRAVLATSSAFNGVASNTPDLIRKSQELYAGVLKSLLRELSETNMREANAQLTAARQRSVSVEMVAVAALFVWYEAIIGTNPNGWIAHAFGAGRILLRRRPEEYRLGLSHHVFRTVRYMMANASILTVQSTLLGSPAWLAIPFSLTIKTSFDRLTDFMLVIPKFLSWVDQKCTNGLPIPPGIDTVKFMKEVLQLEEGLTNFLLVYEKEMINAGEKGLFLDMSRERIDSTGEYHPKMRHYYTEEIAECVTHYEMCRLLIILVKAAFSDASGFITCRAEALEHSASTLSGVAYAEAKSTTKMVREHFGLVCILISILLASPSEAHRNYAKLKIESWGGGNGLIGASPNHPMVRWSALKMIWEKRALPLDIIELASNGEEPSNVVVSNNIDIPVRTL